MGFIKDWIQNYFFTTPEQRQRSDEDRRDSALWKKTRELAEQGRYAEAAEVNMRYALEKLKTNEFIYCSYCIYALEMWLKAKEPDKALQEARNVLRVYVANDAENLIDDTGIDAECVDDLMSIVSKFYAAGYVAEAAVFASEVNHQFEKYDLPMRCAAVPVGKNIFPQSCSDCGANLSHNPYQDTAQCNYCKAIIYALNDTPEIADAEKRRN